MRGRASTGRHALRAAAGALVMVGALGAGGVAGASVSHGGGKDGGGASWDPSPTEDAQAPSIPDTVTVAQAQDWLSGALQLRAQELSSLQTDVGNDTSLPTDVRNNLNGDLSTAANGIAGLTTSVQKDSTLDALRSDASTMVLTYRVFSVVEPEVHLTIVGERQLAIAGQILHLQPGLETAIKTEQGSRTASTLRALDATLTSDLSTIQSNAGVVVSDMGSVSPSAYDSAVGAITADTKVIAGDWSTISDARSTVRKILSLLAG